MHNRVDIKNFILKIEQDFPVNDWKIDDVHLWPILRIRLFFNLIDKLENRQTEKKTILKASFKTRAINLIKKRTKKYLNIVSYFLWKNTLPQKRTIFIGADSHRVDYKSSRFNRYFDVMIDREDLKASSMYFEYGTELENQYNKDIIYKFNKPLKGFLSLNTPTKSNKKSFNGYHDFLLFLQKNEHCADFVSQNQEDRLVKWFETSFAQRILFFTKMLRIIKPERIAILCYYSEDIFALIVAANRLNIETIEMQHGPQTEIHLCYGSWSVVPKEGYDVLPRTFWCWDNYSKEVLEKWTFKNMLYNVEVKGNPWTNHWLDKKEVYPFKDFILYTLQPSPMSHEQLFSTQLIQSIQESKYLWFIRLHPRQLHQLSLIKDLLQKANVLHLVNIENATNDALPLLLANAKMHITHFSGAALEASYFGLKTVLINETGTKSFPHLLESNEAIYIDYKDADFKSKILTLMKS